MLILMDNAGHEFAKFPPHTDYKREIALNFVVTTGGNNVETATYKLPNGVPVDEPTFWNERDLELLDKVVIDAGKWVSFDAQSPHSVDGVQSLRIILAVMPPAKTISTLIGNNSN